MIKKAALGAIASLAFCSAAYSKAPNVAVDIAPLHSLVSQVMDGVNEPALLIRHEASPHGYTLRPSEARALAKADVVFWVGEGLTPWLGRSLNNLASAATQIEMSEVSGLTTYDFRAGATFEAHDHGHENHAHEQHEHDQHDHEHEQHDHEHHDDEHNEYSATEEQHDHHHEGHDPHLWLDPINAQVWVKKIAHVLSEIDPENAATYAKNAQATLAQLASLQAELTKQAEDLHGIKFVVFHDAYQYFEKRFDVIAAGAISISDASDPSPARVQEIRNTVANLGVTCVFTEPQFNPGLVKTVFEHSSVKTIGTMDPLGATITPGKNQYYELLSNMIKSLQQCQR